jgi:hypothetical protein
MEIGKVRNGVLSVRQHKFDIRGNGMMRVKDLENGIRWF